MHLLPQFLCFTTEFFSRLLYLQVRLKIYAEWNNYVKRFGGCICAGWADCTPQSGKFSFYKPATAESSLEACWTLLEDFHWELWSCGQLVQVMPHSLLERLPSIVKTVSGVEQALVLLQGAKICAGNSDENFQQLTRARRGRFMDSTGKQCFSIHL